VGYNCGVNRRSQNNTISVNLKIDSRHDVVRDYDKPLLILAFYGQQGGLYEKFRLAPMDVRKISENVSDKEKTLTSYPIT
jgi:hypothetical protein